MRDDWRMADDRRMMIAIAIITKAMAVIITFIIIISIITSINLLIIYYS